MSIHGITRRFKITRSVIRKTIPFVCFLPVLFLFCSNNPTNSGKSEKYKISGTITGTDSVTVLLTGDVSLSQIVNIGEFYSFLVEEKGNFIVTPQKEGWSFTPGNKIINHIGADVSQNFSAILTSCTISGTITGTDSVTVTLGGSSSDSMVVNSGGSYSFTVAPGDTCTVTPSKTGFTFTPTSQTFSNIASNQIQHFAVASAPVTISGTISGAGGVVVNLSGALSGSQTVADNGGSYSFTVPAGGTYMVTPLKPGYVFTPPSVTFTNVAADQTQNFTCTLNTQVFTISGTVSGIEKATVTLSGNSSGIQVVNNGGTYSFTVPQGGPYTVTPSVPGYSFSPIGFSVQNLTTNRTQNFSFVLPFPVAPIPEGTFMMGNDSERRPRHQVTLSAFEMGTHEITNAQYARFLNAAISFGDIKVVDGMVYGNIGQFQNMPYHEIGFGTVPNRGWITYHNGLFSVTSGYETWPATGVSWYGAKAFALYHVLDLPTEAEWEYACLGGHQYEYGTDDGAISNRKANYSEDGSTKSPVPVGSYPPNPYGLHDMSGNVFEWCHDWYGTLLREAATNPTGPETSDTTPSIRVSRGGSYSHTYVSCRSTYLSGWQPEIIFPHLGFRVVRRPGGLSY